MTTRKAPPIPLPKSWTAHVRSAMLHVISLARFATAYTRCWAVNSVNERVRLKAENCRLRQEFGLLQEEIRIEDQKTASTKPPRCRLARPGFASGLINAVAMPRS